MWPSQLRSVGHVAASTIVAEASTDKAELLAAAVDLDHVATAQTSLPWWRDRRPELYGSLSAA